MAKDFAGAKASARDAIAQLIGDRQADRITNKVLKDNPLYDGISRLGRPNRRAMTKRQLAETLRLAYQEMVRQITGMTSPERLRLIECLGRGTPDDPAAFMCDPRANSIIYLAAAAHNAAQNPRFLDAVHEFESNCRKVERVARKRSAIDRMGDDYGQEDDAAAC